MRNPFNRSRVGEQGPASLFAALVLVALVPAICVLWFMTVAMRNERMAVQGRLLDVYLTHVSSLQQQLTAHWRVRQARLDSLGKGSPSEHFATVVRSNLADSVVFYDRAGQPLYPSSPNLEDRTEENGEWVIAEEEEFQRRDFLAAAGRYGRIALGSADSRVRARALQAKAASLFKAMQAEEAVACLAALTGDPSLRNAANAQGALIVPNAQLVILRHAAGPQNPSAAPWRKTLDDLVDRLNDYAAPDFPSSQRRFLMGEVRALAPDAPAFATLAAEELAAEYLERDPTIPAGAKLQRSPLPKIWRLPIGGQTAVALFQEDRVRKEAADLIDSLALPDLRVTLLSPDEQFASTTPLAPQEAGELLPGWRLGLSFKTHDSFASSSMRQTRLYLWTGLLVVLSILIVALLVARYVGAQMRLARMKSELVSTVSHELKTPLASMRALVDTLAMGRFRDEAQLREYLGLISKENLRLSQLIENFLSFSRLERGSQRFQFEPVSPGAVLQSAVEVLRDRLESLHCRFELRIAPDLPQVQADPEALATVLINLLDNACKYTNGEKRIAARAFADGRQVCFEVEDHGIGLAPAEIRKIFDRFYQVNQSLTRQQGGCGLGLSIVCGIVEAHHGTVEVDSEPGQGSTFRVRIPVAKSAS